MTTAASRPSASEAVIVGAVRTPLGKRNGALADIHPVDLAARTLNELIDRTEVDPALIDDVITGCVMQVGEQGLNIARNAVLAAGWPESVPGTTVDRQCGSSQQALHFAAQGVMSGTSDVVVANGVEVMTRVPMGASMSDGQFGFPYGPAVTARYAARGGLVPQGLAAELIADEWDITREEMDEFGLRSQRLAARASTEGRFEAEMVLIERADGSVVRRDEGVRETSMAALAALEPSFRPRIEGGRVTAGNSSQITDGAAAVLVMSAEMADEVAGALRVDGRRHRPVRDQRGLRLGRHRLGARGRRAARARERQRRSDRIGAPARLQRRTTCHDDAPRARTPRRPVRSADDL
jgi:acetyl-CoA acetyltransferase family protein